MSESKDKLLEMREDLLNAIANVQMKLKSFEEPSVKLCTVCDTTCAACAGTCAACQGTKVA